jgi:hypothetical protein
MQMSECYQQTGQFGQVLPGNCRRWL